MGGHIAFDKRFALVEGFLGERAARKGNSFANAFKHDAFVRHIYQLIFK